jgi:phage gpG-like protein
MPSGGFISVSFKVEGQKEISRNLATWGAKIETMAPAWERVADDLEGDFALNMAQEGGYFGTFSKWAPLKPSTVKDRTRKGYGGAHPILWRTGALANSLFKGAGSHVRKVGDNSLEVGSDLFYAGFHQSGTRKMVARKVVGISSKRRTEIVKRLNEYIMDIARQQGLDTSGGE